MEFTSLVWTIPILLLFGVIIAFTLNHNKKTTKFNISLAIMSFVLSICVVGERLLLDVQDYGYYIDWFILDNFYYRIGYELNHTAALFIVMVTALNLILHVINEQFTADHKSGINAYLNLIFGLLSAIVIADNVLTYYIVSFLISVALFLKLANLNVVGMIHTLRKFSKTFIIGHLLFLCALMLIFYHQPSHAVEFTVIDSSLHMQPDLLNMDSEWIIGLLLVLSTIFTSTVLVPFEVLLRKQALNHLVTLYVLMSLKIILPAYLLIRFESLIRLDHRTETFVILLGVLILLITCIRGRNIKSMPELLIMMSNAMLGMLYMLFGLQANLLLTASVLIFMCAYLFSLFLLLFSKRQMLFNLTKLLIGVILFVPFVICISTSNHYSAYNVSELIINAVLWLGLITYSFCIFFSLFGLKRDSYKIVDSVAPYTYTIYSISFFIIMLTIGTVMTSWWSEFLLEDRHHFTTAFNKQVWTNFIFVCIYIGAGFLIALIKTRLNKRGKKDQELTPIRFVSLTKAVVVYSIDAIERIWNYCWETAVPYLFKKGERYFAARPTPFVQKLIFLWFSAVIVAILLVMVRG